MNEAHDAFDLSDVSVVMPAFNERALLELSVGDVVEGLRARGLTFEVVICENGSTDETAQIAERLSEKYTEVLVVELPSADYGAALHEGLARARGRIVVTFDVDLYDLDFLDVASRMIEGPDPPAIVVGSKRAPGARDERPPHRKVVTATFALLLRVLFGLRVSDTHGMKAMSRCAVAPIASECRFGKDLFDTELILRAERAGSRVAEIPVDVVERRPARTSILRRVPRTLFGLAKLRIALRRDRL